MKLLWKDACRLSLFFVFVTPFFKAHGFICDHIYEQCVHFCQTETNGKNRPLCQAVCEKKLERCFEETSPATIDPHVNPLWLPHAPWYDEHHHRRKHPHP